MENEKEEIALQKRISELQKKEKSLLRTSLSKISKKSMIVVDTKKISICERLGSGASGAVVYSCIVDGIFLPSRIPFLPLPYSSIPFLPLSSPSFFLLFLFSLRFPSLSFLALTLSLCTLNRLGLCDETIGQRK